MMSLCGFFLLSIKNKSSASFHLGIAFLLLGIFAWGYFWTSSIYHESSAFHRWLTVGMVFPCSLHVTQFFFHFPRLIHPRLAKIVFIIQYGLSALLIGYFFYQTAFAPKIYHFAGHYWDFDREEASAVIAFAVMLYILVFVVFGIWRAVITPGPDRWAILAMLFSLMIITVVPSILNTLSREGALDRGIYTTVWDLLAVLGTFGMLVVFINNTKDRTSFMDKITGISLVVVLLIMEFLSFFLIRERDNSYDAAHSELSSRILLDNSVPADLEYSVRYSIPENRFESRSGANIALNFEEFRTELLNTAVLDEIQNLPDENFDTTLKECLSRSPVTFGGYGRALEEIASRIPAGQIQRGKTAAEKLNDLKNTVLYRFNKIKKLPDENFRRNLKEFLPKSGDAFRPFRQAIENHLQISLSEGASLKAETLEFLRPVQPSGTRHYRRDAKKAYVSFMKSDLKNNVVHELGYSYTAYRDYVHPAGLTLILMLAAVLVIILVGFRFFFSGALVNPLDALLDGVRHVNEGDLSVVVGVKVEDEIGFLSRSFNGMVASISDAKKKLQDYADHLEEKVKDRTRELQNSLDEIRILKQQQDGDYFLTSLLIKPFAADKSEPGPVSVEFLVKQKKQFEFRKWREEIGGDLCMAHSVVLKGKNHTVFINADAMGKSMQGAGGALVLGSVFDAMVERTKLTPALQNQYPERWLKYAFIELQKVFESFNGSMLVSLVMGLVDDESGLLYFLNAEHPWTVLYRGGKASFIESELLFRKLGTQGMDGTIYIRTLQLQRDDIIIAGSDGRDDILVGIDDSGERIINEDEQLFLRIVEKGHGDLQQIYSGILTHGDLTDDLSMVRIAYREDQSAVIPSESADTFKEYLKQAQALFRSRDWITALEVLKKAHALNDTHPVVLKGLARTYFHLKKFELAAAFAEDFVFINPGELEFVYMASYCYKLAGELEKALDLGERVRLRDPGLVKNLINLSEIYFKTGNKERARMLAGHALQLEPNNERAVKMIEQHRLSLMENL